MDLKKREIQYDYLRTLAVFAIIMVHAIPSETLNSRQWLFSAALMPVLLAFVGIFFMISGMFFLKTGTENILLFYKKRFHSIVIPFVCYSGIYYWYYNVYLSQEKTGIFEHLSRFIKAFITGTIPMAPHMWFMYVIISLYLCTPFLARMANAMSDKDLKLFLVLMIFVQGMCTYLPSLGLEVGESFQYVIFKGWLIYFMLGYGWKRLYGGRSCLPFAVLGLAGFGVTMFQKIATPYFTPGIHDIAPSMMAMALSIFVFFETFGNVKVPVLTRFAGFVSRYSYSIYLIHYLVLGQLARGLVEKTVIRHYYVPKIFCETAVTFLISLAAAWILDSTVIKVLKRVSGRWFFGKKDRERRN
ncbi:MAG: acyltransferase [Lacrimispora sp.]|uniref:acyltransferase n=1 Tax=Lacrimispora sp. TaxID=2719234 RepID=UPI0039E2277C